MTDFRDSSANVLPLPHEAEITGQEKKMDAGDHKLIAKMFRGLFFQTLCFN